MSEEVDRRIRKIVFDFFLERTFAPSVDEIAALSGVSRELALESLRRLDAAHHLKLLDGTERILMAFPFSAISTPYRVTRPSGQRYFANCAWDAVAFHVMLKEPVEISSFCVHCGDPIRFRVDSGHGVLSPRPLPSVFLALPAAEWWNDIVRTCSNTMVFLESRNHFDKWRGPEAGSSGALLTIEQVVGISRLLYETKLDLNYERPSKATLQNEFESLGLTGDFWRL